MSKELAIVEHVLKTRRDVDMLEALVEHIPTMPTPDLVTGFRLANTFVKRIETFTDAAKKELVDNATMKGRFLSEGRTDEKGHRYLAGADNDELKAEKRVSTKLDVEKAKEVLIEHNLLLQGTDEAFVVNPEDVHGAVNRLMPTLRAWILEAQVADTDVVMVDVSTLTDMAEELDGLIRVDRKVNEAKIEALVTLGELPVEEVENLMKTTIQYAVKEVKAKKK